MTLANAWEHHARDWLAWADPENADGFWTVTWPTLRDLLPAPDGLVVDLGCGEGRGLRELCTLGYDVIGIDRSPTLVRAAAALLPDSRVLLGDAARLPLATGCASMVFASMSLLDLDDLDSALAEVRRVLRTGGVLCAAVIHPFQSAFSMESIDAGEFRLAAPYLQPHAYEDSITRNGRSMTFTSMHLPLRAYLDPLFARGFVLTAIREEGHGPIPWLLAFRAQLPSLNAGTSKREGD